MNLSEHDRKFVDQLHRRGAAWRKARWPFLLIGIAGLLFWFFWAYPAMARQDEFVLLLMHPVILFNVAACAFLVGKVLRDWNGNAIETLLVRLIEEKERSEQKAGETTSHSAPGAESEASQP